LLYRGNRITAFLYDGTLYSTERVTSEYPVRAGVLLQASSDNDSILVIGMMVDSEALFLVASDGEGEANLVLEYNNLRTERHVRLAVGEAVLLRFPYMSQPDEVLPIATAQR
jgi:hypothetical protein